MWRALRSAAVLGVIALIVWAIASAVSGAKPAPAISTPSTLGVASYHVAGLSSLVLDPSHLSLDFTVTNIGHAAGTPGCVITATSTAGVSSVGSVLLSRVDIGDVDIAANVKVTIRDEGASAVPLKGIEVSCSSV